MREIDESLDEVINTSDRKVRELFNNLVRQYARVSDFLGKEPDWTHNERALLAYATRWRFYRGKSSEIHELKKLIRTIEVYEIYLPQTCTSKREWEIGCKLYTSFDKLFDVVRSIQR